MMLDAEKWAKAKGFNSINLLPVSKARDFYKKCGYSENLDFKGYFEKKILN